MHLLTRMSNARLDEIVVELDAAPEPLPLERIKATRKNRLFA